MDTARGAETHPGDSSDEDEQFLGEPGEGDRVLDDLEDVPEDGEQPMSSDDEDEENTAAGSEEVQQIPDDAVQMSGRHAESVFAVAWNQVAESTVASGGGDDKAFLFQAGGDSSLELGGHTDSVACLAFSADGTKLATGGLDGRVKVWDAHTGTLLHTLEGPEEGVTWLQWHPRGSVLLAGSEDFTTWMWNADSAACMQVFTGHSGAVSCGAFTPDGRSVVTGGGAGDASLRVWSPRSGECTATVSGHAFHQAGLTCLAVNSASAVISGAEDGSVCLSNIETGKVLGGMAGHEDSVEAVAFSSNMATLVVSAGLDGRLVVWDTAAFDSRNTCTHPQGIVAMVCHPSAPFIFTGGLDGVLRQWDLRTGQCTASRTGHSEGIQCLALSPDGQFAITGSDDGTARIFSVPTPQS